MRIAFDLDGVLADFAGAYRNIANRLHPRRGPVVLALAASAAEDAPGGRPSGRLERRIWREITSTENFWQTLDPLDPGLIGALHVEHVRRGWETFFVTQRPATAGATVQRQTQQWLVEHGFALPSVIVHCASRGQLAAALELDFLVDDTIAHCVDVIDESDATPILVCREEDAIVETNADRLGIAVCRTGAEALGLIRRATLGGRSPVKSHT